MEEKIYIDSTDGIKLCALLGKVSKDKIVLLCHGIRSNKNEKGSYDVLAKEIQNHGYSTIRIDFRGHGESTGLDYEVTITKEIEDVESVIKFLRDEGYKEIIVFGGSFGASIISFVDYSRFEEVKGLIFWYGALDNYNALRNDYFLSERNKQIALKEGFCTTYNREGKPFRFGVPLFEEIDKYKPMDAIKSIKLPKIFVHGLTDRYVSHEESIKAYNECENARLALIENGDHNFNNDEQALKDAIEKTIEFIEEIF